MNIGTVGERAVIESGIEFEMFDDVPILGFQSLDRSMLAKIEPFDLKDVVVYHPGFLTGWSALAYDFPLTEASLAAREKVARKLRNELHKRVKVDTENRTLSAGAHHWSGMTFKLLLLPIYQAVYKYKGSDYTVFVNGQTGKVGGKKPVDRVKTFMLQLTLGLGLFFLLILILMVGFASMRK
jgi:hypothetical protein